MRHQPNSDPRRWLAFFVGVILAALLASVSTATAQETTWRERRTANFAILFPVGAEAEAESYARFVDGVYEETSAVFSYRTPPPVVLRIYPTMELYERVNPLAAQLPGVVAHAHTGRREISIALPQTVSQSPDQIVNNVRHELTHIIAADLSEDKLTTAFQEGIAQYVEHPSAELDAKMQLMQQVITVDRVLPWRELNQPGVAYSDPRISYPQSYTMVAFLIERDGFATFRRFLELSATSSGYRSALEGAYGVGADQLEAEWRAQLDAFVAGAYRDRAVGAFDLSRAEDQIARGEYQAAIAELEAAIATLDASQQGAVAERARELLRQAVTGERAASLADQARTALERGAYDEAHAAAAEGRALLGQAGHAAQLRVMDQYVQLAVEGLAAQQELQTAGDELRSFQINAARARLAGAYQTFTRLGDEQHAGMAQSSLVRIQRTETGVAIGLVVIAAVMIGWNVHRRVNERDETLPFS